MDYPILPTVYASGIAKTGLTSIINDRNTSLTVPWEASQTGNKNIVWTIASDDTKTYRVTVPVSISVSSGSTTVSYAKNSVTIQEVQ